MMTGPHHYRMQCGVHKGELITRVPVGYLLWMVREHHGEAEVAQAELDRRGTVLPDFEVSGHAIDRASLKCLTAWKKHRAPGEGLHAWLCRAGAEAVKCPEKKDGKHAHMGLLWVFAMDGVWPALKTVMPDKHASKAPKPRGHDEWPFAMDDACPPP